MIPRVVVVAAAAGLVPVGYEFDCKSWQQGNSTTVTVTLVARDGGENVGRFRIAGDSTVADFRIALVAALEGDDWAVKAGPNETVTVFAPKGQSVKSVKIDTDFWQPKYRPVFGKLVLPKK